MSGRDSMEKKISRRDLLKGLGGLAAGSAILPILSACSSSAPTPAPTSAPSSAAPTTGAAPAGAPTGAPAPATASKKVVFARTRDPSGTADKMVQAFNALKKGVEVELRVMPDTSADYRNILVPQLQAKSGDIDVFLTDVIWTGEFAAAGWMMDITQRFSDSMRKDFLEGAVGSTLFNGKYWAVPFYTDAGVLWYRKDILEDQLKVKPPETWDDLVKVGQMVQEKNKDMSGYIFQAALHEGLALNVMEFMWSNGGDVLDDKSNVVLKNDKNVAALQKMVDLIYKDKISPEAVTSSKTTENNQVFFEGRAAMMRSWPFVWGTLAATKNAAIDQSKLGVSTLTHGPGGKSYGCLGGWNAAVNPYSKNPDAAWTFLEWLTGPDGQKMNGIGRGELMTRKGFYDDAEVLKAAPIIKMFAPMAASTKSRPVSPFYQDISTALQQNFHAALTRQISAADAINKANDQLISIVKRS